MQIFYVEKKTMSNLSFEKIEWNMIVKFIWNAQISVLKSVFLVETLHAHSCIAIYMYILILYQINAQSDKIQNSQRYDGLHCLSPSQL